MASPRRPSNSGMRPGNDSREESGQFAGISCTATALAYEEACWLDGNLLDVVAVVLAAALVGAATVLSASISSIVVDAEPVCGFLRGGTFSPTPLQSNKHRKAREKGVRND